MHHHPAANALAFAFSRIQNAIAFFQTGINPTNVKEPTNGSFIILKARPDIGSASSAPRTMLRVSYHHQAQILYTPLRRADLANSRSPLRGSTPFLKAGRGGTKDMFKFSPNQALNGLNIWLKAVKKPFHDIIILLDDRSINSDAFPLPCPQALVGFQLSAK